MEGGRSLLARPCQEGFTSFPRLSTIFTPGGTERRKLCSTNVFFPTPALQCKDATLAEPSEPKGLKAWFSFTARLSLV
jgi:hypothetical protein